jgi:hypothetical protein
MMKRPLIATIQTSDESLEAEEQTRLEQDKQQGKGLVWQAFLLGIGIGSAQQVIVFATGYIILKIWGQNPIFSGSLSLLSYWILVILSKVNVGIYICFWLVLVFLYTRSMSGYLYLLRKKLDQDADDTPAGSNSIWSARPRRLFVVGVYFLFGVNMGIHSGWTLVHLYMGVADRFMALPYVVGGALFWLVLKCLECEQKTRGEEQGEEEGR